MDLKNASLDDLLSDILDRSAPERSLVANWLEAAGIFPGTTRVRAQDLYAEFTEWCVSDVGITDEITAIREFGKELARRFKRGRPEVGTVYYISRTKDPKIPGYLGVGK